MSRRKRLLSRDVPRPQDTALQCVDRIKQYGSNHAVCDLIDRLEKDGDPRFEILAGLRQDVYERCAMIPEGDPRYATAAVTYWQQLGLWCVRVMEHPELVALAEDTKRQLGINGLAL